jgi:UDPglucose 6-dehydrogenase
MKIGIVGLGTVGGACKFGFEKLGHEVLSHDPKLNSSLTDVLDAEIVFVCVPTPANDDGSCNTSIVEETVESLQEHGYRGVVAIKSTVEPGTTKKLRERTSMNVCFVPEFLRERCAISDFVENHILLAVGCEDAATFEVVKRAHGRFPKQAVMLGLTESEFLKYYSNVINAVRVIFANEFYETCNALEASYEKVKDAYIMTGQMPDRYLDVNESFRGYGGVCLPKDVKAIVALQRKLGLNLGLFASVDEENKRYETTVPEGMRIK